MQEALTEIGAVTRKELRELMHRPLLILTLIVGPLAVLIIFGIGSNATPAPPRAIIVVPPGQGQTRLIQEYQQQFEEALQVAEYTSDEAYARARLAQNQVDAVLILPPSPFKTITSGQRATITVLYNEIDPLWRGLVPQFVRGLAADINRQIFLQTAGDQQVALSDASGSLDTLVEVIDQAVAAAERQDWQSARQEVRTALTVSEQLLRVLAAIGPQAEPLRVQLAQAHTRLQQIDALLGVAEQALSTPTTEDAAEQLGLLQTRQRVQGLRDAIIAYTAVPPDVVIAPLAVKTELVARLTPDFITFFAPAILALLLQHVAVSLGSLAFVRERLVGTFDLYVVAPIANVRLLLGKYLAYTLFTLLIAAVVLAVLLLGLGVPLFGSRWRVGLTLVLLTVASLGLGFALSLAAASERQAVQFSMLALLGVVFFSGFALPLKALQQPALSVSYVLPATYGAVLLQDLMLRGVRGSDGFLLALGLMAVALFGVSWFLLRWRTAAR